MKDIIKYILLLICKSYVINVDVKTMMFVCFPWCNACIDECIVEFSQYGMNNGTKNR